MPYGQMEDPYGFDPRSFGGGVPPPDPAYLGAPLAPPLSLPPPMPPSIEELSKEETEKVRTYVSNFCRVGRAYVINKKDEWDLLNHLYENDISLDTWANWRSKSRTQDASKSRKEILTSEDDSGNKKTDYVHAPGYIIDSWVDASYSAIFDGPDWLVASLSPYAEGNMAAGPLPASTKVQRHLVSELKRGSIHDRMYDCLVSWANMGSVYAKAFMANTGSFEEVPCFQMIPLDTLIPDKTARHADVQRWRGIAHTVLKSYDDLLACFENGQFDLNRKEFEKRWKDGKGTKGGSGTEEADHVYNDPDREGDEEETLLILKEWEFHGRVPTPKGLLEIICTIITEKDIDDPEDGVMVRLTDGPMLILKDWPEVPKRVGLRPFLSAQLKGRPEAFGRGLLHSIQDILYNVSQSIAQLQDVARKTARTAYAAPKGGELEQTIKDNGDEVPDGKVIFYDYGEDPSKIISPIAIGNFPADALDRHVARQLGFLDRRSVTPTFTGTSQGGVDTATEASLLQQQSQAGVNAQLHRFGETFVGPLGMMALVMLYQYRKGDTRVPMPGSLPNQMQMVPLSREELNPAYYCIEAAITRQDANRMMRAQLYKDLFVQSVNFVQPLAMQGKKWNVVQNISLIADALATDRAGELIQDMTPEEQQNYQMAMQAEAMSANTASNPNRPPMPGETNMPEQQPTRPGANGTGPYGEHGGPFGPEPSDANAQAQLEQIAAQMAQGGMQ